MKGCSRQINWFINSYPSATREPVLDVGCGDAASLKYFGAGSVGLDGDDRYSVENEDWQVYKWVFDQDISATLLSAKELAKFKFVCCLNTLEHALSPHLHLLNLRRVLVDGGYLYLTIPLARTKIYSLFKFLLPKKINKFWKGYLQSDHVNFWVPDTFDLTVEYAGFEIVKRYYGTVPYSLSGINWINKLLGRFSPTYGVVCKKIPGWNYKEKDSVWKRLNNDGFLEWVSRIEK